MCNLCCTFTSRNLGIKEEGFVGRDYCFSTQHMFPLFSADLKLFCLPLLWAMLRSRVTDASQSNTKYYANSNHISLCDDVTKPIQIVARFFTGF